LVWRGLDAEATPPRSAFAASFRRALQQIVVQGSPHDKLGVGGGARFIFWRGGKRGQKCRHGRNGKQAARHLLPVPSCKVSIRLNDVACWCVRDNYQAQEASPLIGWAVMEWSHSRLCHI
jgi:hypothetical protein